MVKNNFHLFLLCLRCHLRRSAAFLPPPLLHPIYEPPLPPDLRSDSVDVFSHLNLALALRSVSTSSASCLFFSAPTHVVTHITIS